MWKKGQTTEEIYASAARSRVERDAAEIRLKHGVSQQTL